MNSRYSTVPLWTRPYRISFLTPPDSLTVLDISGHMRRSLSETACARYLAWQSSGEPS